MNQIRSGVKVEWEADDELNSFVFLFKTIFKGENCGSTESFPRPSVVDSTGFDMSYLSIKSNNPGNSSALALWLA